MSVMASLAGDTAAAAADAAAESVTPSRLRDKNGHKGMQPAHKCTDTWWWWQHGLVINTLCSVQFSMIVSFQTILTAKTKLS